MTGSDISTCGIRLGWDSVGTLLSVWSRHDTRGHTTESGGASSSTGERRSQDSGKKHKGHVSWKAQGKILNVTCEDVWDKILSGKKEPGQDVQNSDGVT